MGTELLTFHVFLSKRIDDSVLCRSSFYDMLPLWPLLSLSLLHNIVKDNQIRVQKEKFSFPISPAQASQRSLKIFRSLFENSDKKFPKQIICSRTFVDLFGAVGNGPSMERLNFSHSIAGISMEWSPNYSWGYFQIQIRHRNF